MADKKVYLKDPNPLPEGKGPIYEHPAYDRDTGTLGMKPAEGYNWNKETQRWTGPNSTRLIKNPRGRLPVEAAEVPVALGAPPSRPPQEEERPPPPPPPPPQEEEHPIPDDEEGEKQPPVEQVPKGSNFLRKAFQPSPYAPMTWMENNLSPESMSMIYGRGTQIKPLYDIQTRGVRANPAPKRDAQGNERRPRTAIREPYAGYSMEGANPSMGTGAATASPFAQGQQSPSYRPGGSPEDLLHRSRMYGDNMYNPGVDPSHSGRTSGMNNPPPRRLSSD